MNSKKDHKAIIHEIIKENNSKLKKMEIVFKSRLFEEYIKMNYNRLV